MIDSQKGSPAAKSRHFLFCCDQNMLEPMIVTWSSICRHMGDRHLVFHWRHMGIPDDRLHIVERWCLARGISLRSYDHSSHGFGVNVAKPEMTNATLLRLVSLEKLEEPGERLLYLDCDLLVLESLDSLFEMPLGDHPCAAARDGVLHQARKKKKTLGIPEEHGYYNAGVLMIHVDRWNKGKVGENALRFLKQNPSVCPFLDQDALNAVLKGRMLDLDERFNRFSLLEKSTSGWGGGQWSVIHYSAHPKPWKLSDLLPRHCARALVYWQYAESGLYPWRARRAVLMLRARMCYHSLIDRAMRSLTVIRKRITPPILEVHYRRVMFLMTGGRWR